MKYILILSGILMSCSGQQGYRAENHHEGPFTIAWIDSSTFVNHYLLLLLDAPDDSIWLISMKPRHLRYGSDTTLGLTPLHVGDIRSMNIKILKDDPGLISAIFQPTFITVTYGSFIIYSTDPAFEKSSLVFKNDFYTSEDIRGLNIIMK
jgi:hypothetical protein